MKTFRLRFPPIAVLAIAALAVCRESPGQVAPTPPMGWNSYDSYGALVTEQQFRANIDYMAEHLKPHGYEYVVLDYCWSYPYRDRGRTGSEALNQRYNEDEKLFTPRLAMDDNGRLLPDKSRFPSAYDAEGKFVGLARLAHYIHGKGLKFGIHIMRGIPRQAVVADCKIAGSDATASQVADTSNTCGWLNHMYGLKTEDGEPTGKLTAGAQAYYDSIVKMYADWGVDFIKADDMLRDFSKPNRSFYAGEINGVRRAIDNTGRPIVFSLSPGAAPLGHAKELADTANMWRMLDDMWDNWKHVNSVFDVARNWTETRATGRWPDADMLPLGTFVRPPVGNARKSKLTANEQRTVVTLWCIARSPLILGCDLPSLENDEDTSLLITNDEVLSVDQQSTKNRQISLSANAAVWAAESEDGKKVYVALFNRGAGEREVAVEFADLGLGAGPYSVRDLWSSKDLGAFTGSLKQVLGEHAAGLYEIVKSAAAKN